MFVILWSLVVLTEVLLLVQLIRAVLKKVFSEDVFKFIDEMLAFLQLSCGILELGVISKIYGFRSLEAILSTFIFLVLKHILFFKGDYVGSPITFVDSYYLSKRQRNYKLQYVTAIVSVELVGSLLAHPFLRLFWGTSFSMYHNKQVFRECRSTLLVPFWSGFFVEIFASFISSGSDLLTPFKAKPAVRAAMTILLSQIFEKTSGVWMNPVIATAHTFRCIGHGNTIEHIIIYWIGPIVGVALAHELNLALKVFILSDAVKPASRVIKSCIIRVLSRENMSDVCTDRMDVPSDADQNGGKILTTKYNRTANGSLRPRSSIRKSRGW